MFGIEFILFECYEIGRNMCIRFTYATNKKYDCGCISTTSVAKTIKYYRATALEAAIFERYYSHLNASYFMFLARQARLVCKGIMRIENVNSLKYFCYKHI